MRSPKLISCSAALFRFIPVLINAQGQSETSHAVPGGGIPSPGWTGKADATAESGGQTVNDAKLSQEGDSLHITTGPAVTYWNPANKASGDYTGNPPSPNQST